MFAALSHPRLADCRRLFLRNYEVHINIGVHDFEKRGEQRVVINVELFVPLALSTPVQDKLNEVVDYDFMRSTIRAASSKAISTCRKRCATTSSGPCSSIRRCGPRACRPRSRTCIPTATPWASKSSVSKRIEP